MSPCTVDIFAQKGQEHSTLSCAFGNVYTFRRAIKLTCLWMIVNNGTPREGNPTHHVAQTVHQDRKCRCFPNHSQKKFYFWYTLCKMRWHNEVYSMIRDQHGRVSCILHEEGGSFWNQNCCCQFQQFFIKMRIGQYLQLSFPKILKCQVKPDKILTYTRRKPTKQNLALVPKKVLIANKYIWGESW